MRGKGKQGKERGKADRRGVMVSYPSGQNFSTKTQLITSSVRTHKITVSKHSLCKWKRWKRIYLSALLCILHCSKPTLQGETGREINQKRGINTKFAEPHQFAKPTLAMFIETRQVKYEFKKRKPIFRALKYYALGDNL